MEYAAITEWRLYETGNVSSEWNRWNTLSTTPPKWGRAISAPPFRRRTVRRRFLILFLELWRKNNEVGNFLNAVEREPVENRVLNPTASEAIYKPKQRSYRTTNLKKYVRRNVRRRNVQRRNGGA